MGCRIKEVREKLCITQEELAERSGLTVSTIAALESDKSHVTTSKTLLAISKALGVTLDELFFPESEWLSYDDMLKQKHKNDLGGMDE